MSENIGSPPTQWFTPPTSAPNMNPASPPKTNPTNVSGPRVDPIGVPGTVSYSLKHESNPSVLQFYREKMESSRSKQWWLNFGFGVLLFVVLIMFFVAIIYSMQAKKRIKKSRNKLCVEDVEDVDGCDDLEKARSAALRATNLSWIGFGLLVFAIFVFVIVLLYKRGKRNEMMSTMVSNLKP